MAASSGGLRWPTPARLLVLAAVLVLPTACAGQPLTTAMDKDNGGQVHVSVGGTLSVRLDAIPGTGYGWEVVTVNRDLLSPTGTPTLEPPGAGQPGAVEKQVFRFQALKPGSSTIELYYRRPWEKDVPPQKTFRLRVEVR